MNKTKVAAGRTRKTNRRRRNGIDGQRDNGASANGERSRGRVRNWRGPGNELDPAIQRYIDLYEFAPIAYVALDRSGRIRDFNLATIKLLDRKREYFRGLPFSLCILPADLDLFLRHLARCRADEPRVETNLRLKKHDGAQLSVVLSSTPTTSLVRDGAQLFQTAIVDLTERERADTALRESEERYRTLFNLGPIAIYSVDASGVIQTFNRRAAELWGREPALGDTDQRFCGSFKMFRPDGTFMPHEQSPMAEVISGKITAVHDAEVLIERPDGSRVIVLANIRPLKNDRGEVIGAINCFYDITERKIAETAAMRLAAVVRSSHDAIAAKDLNGVVTDWNQSAERIFGYKAKEIIGKSILTLIPKDRHQEETEILRKIRHGKSIEHYQTVRRCKDGRLIDVSLTISPIRDANGKIVGASKVTRDITKLKQTERRLAEQTRLLDLSNEAILVRDTRDRILYWNHGATEIYGYAPEEALGKVTRELLRTKPPEPFQNIQSKLERDHRWSGELVHTRKDGSEITVMSRWALDHDAEGKPASILETNTDITLRKEAETALQMSKQLLEELVQKRTKALRSANVELENEIARRKGMEGQILEISDREQERLGQELHDGLCQQLTAIGFMARAAALRLKDHRVVQVEELEKISQLINGSVMDARNIAHDLHKEEIDAAGLKDALRDLTERKIWKTPCLLRCDDDLNIEDDTVASALFRILREGVINANKHARATEIVLEACRRKRELVFSVTDNGVGLNGREQNENHGLGFHIMNYRAQSIGARLELESPRRGGTRVAVYLPLDK